MRDVTGILKVTAKKATKCPTRRTGPHTELRSYAARKVRSASFCSWYNSYNQSPMLQVREEGPREVWNLSKVTQLMTEEPEFQRKAISH